MRVASDYESEEFKNQKAREAPALRNDESLLNVATSVSEWTFAFQLTFCPLAHARSYRFNLSRRQSLVPGF